MLNIFIIAIVSFVVAKWVVPKLTANLALRSLIKFVLKPFDKAKDEIDEEWEKAKQDEGWPEESNTPEPPPPRE